MAQRMTRGTLAGFTIIETILFLAITGVLVAALLGGVGLALGNQRYLDSVQSFKLLLQGQYSDLDTVANDRSDDWQCTSTAKTSQPTSGSTKPRGQSDCFIVGRYIVIERGDVSMTDVIASEGTGTKVTSGDDITKLKANYHLNLSTVHTETQQLEWGTEIAWPVSDGSDPAVPAAPHDPSKPKGTARSIVILLIRSPDSGTIYTFTKNPSSGNETDPAKVAETDIRAMIIGGDTVPGQGDRLICLESNGLSTVGTMGFYIGKYATNASDVETRSNDTKLAGGDSEC